MPITQEQATDKVIEAHLEDENELLAFIAQLEDRQLRSLRPDFAPEKVVDILRRMKATTGNPPTTSPSELASMAQDVKELVAIARSSKAPSTVSLSSMNTGSWDKVTSTTGLEVDTFKPTHEPTADDGDIPAFEWDALPEERSQRTRYMEYLEGIITLPNGLSWYDGNKSTSLLTVEPDLTHLPFKLTGTTDVAIVESDAVDNLLPRTGLKAVFELKKAVDDGNRDSVFQAMAELFCASTLSGKHRPFGVLTDLKNFWQLYWVDGRVIQVYRPKSRAIAVTMINRLLKEGKGSEEVSGVDPLDRVYKRARYQPPADAVPVQRSDVAQLADLEGFLPNQELAVAQLTADLRSLRCLLGMSDATTTAHERPVPPSMYV